MKLNRISTLAAVPAFMLATQATAPDVNAQDASITNEGPRTGPYKMSFSGTLADVTTAPPAFPFTDAQERHRELVGLFDGAAFKVIMTVETRGIEDTGRGDNFGSYARCTSQMVLIDFNHDGLYDTGFQTAANQGNVSIILNDVLNRDRLEMGNSVNYLEGQKFGYLSDYAKTMRDFAPTLPIGGVTQFSADERIFRNDDMSDSLTILDEIAESSNPEAILDNQTFTFVVPTQDYPIQFFAEFAAEIQELKIEPLF